MQQSSPFSRILPRLLAIVLLAMIVSACAQATPAALPLSTTAPIQPTSVPPTATVEIVASSTPTEEPTATTAPTETPVPPTSTSVPTAVPTLGVAGDGLSAWCLPTGMLPTLYNDPAAPPQSAVAGAKTDAGFDMSNLPYAACTFIYKFNQAVEPGMKLQVFEADQKSPWLTADLLAVESAPDSAAAQLTHSYIVAPPLWDVGYDFVVVGADGSEIRRDRVNLHRWKPELCWNGQLPNINTLRCPLMQDLHPWDPSYLTPFPTLTPQG